MATVTAIVAATVVFAYKCRGAGSLWAPGRVVRLQIILLLTPLGANLSFQDITYRKHLDLAFVTVHMYDLNTEIRNSYADIENYLHLYSH